MSENGIYCYRDFENNGEIVYIGKDSNINKHVRHTAHLAPSAYNVQPFNCVLQNNSDRYQYQVLRTGEFDENWLNALEILYIRRYQPKFNFTVGGDGCTGRKCSEETKLKISEATKDKTRTKEQRINMSNAQKGKKLSEEHKKNISRAFTGEKHPMYGKHHSEESKRKISEAKKKNYARIIKKGKTRSGKQNYSIYMDGKYLKQSISPSKLLDWFTKEYPTEILQIKTGDNNNSDIGEKPCN